MRLLMLKRMRHDDIKVGDLIVLTEDAAWNLVEILKREKENAQVTLTVKHLRQIRPHPFASDITPGTVTTLMFVQGMSHYCGWHAASLDEIRKQPGFQEEWLTPGA
jgi:hypothetical protein